MWEYKEVCPERIESDDTIEKILNQMGSDNWELVSFQLLAPITGKWFHAIFKRINAEKQRIAIEMVMQKQD